MYFTDRGIEELDDRRGDEQVSIAWLAERLRDFVDEHPEAEATVDGLASWLARLDDEEDDEPLEPGAPATPAGQPDSDGTGSPPENVDDDEDEAYDPDQDDDYDVDTYDPDEEDEPGLPQ
jgi:hypothetical protein